MGVPTGILPARGINSATALCPWVYTMSTQVSGAPNRIKAMFVVGIRGCLPLVGNSGYLPVQFVLVTDIILQSYYRRSGPARVWCELTKLVSEGYKVAE